MADLQAIGYQFDYDDFGSFVHGRLAYEMLKPAAPPSFLTSSCSAHHYAPTCHVTVPSLLIWTVLCNPLLQGNQTIPFIQLANFVICLPLTPKQYFMNLYILSGTDRAGCKSRRCVMK